MKSLDALKEQCQKLGNQTVIITDETVGRLYGEQVQAGLNATHVITFPAGEAYKTRETKSYLEDELLARDIGRDTCLVALGGGVVTDMVGFLAATFCRGVPVVYIPTTLLCMVDAAWGGKTGVNTQHGKNMIGTFTDPRAVHVDPYFLNTLPQEETNNGLVELIKHSLIADPEMFYQLLNSSTDDIKPFLARGVHIKQRIIEEDKLENGKRKLLNLGHTIGHAIESASNYTIRHGEAVAIGIVAECAIAKRMGLLHQDDCADIIECFRRKNIPLSLDNYPLDIDKVWAYLRHDKKNKNQQVYCVLLEDIGKPYIKDYQYAHAIPEHLLTEVCEPLC